MTILFSENFEKLAKFIFDFYDFDKDGEISKEDVRVVLSYIPLNIQKYSKEKLKFENEEFKDRVESQDELHLLLEKCFQKFEYLNETEFSNTIENISSDIFLFILIFLLEKKPFSKTTIQEFQGRKLNTTLIKVNKTPLLQSRLIASPNLQSKFSPSVTISKSPMMKKRSFLTQTPINKSNPLNNLTNNNESKNFLLKFAGNNNPKDQAGSKSVLMKYAISVNLKDKTINPEEDTDEGVSIKNIPVNRKKRNDLKNLETAIPPIEMKSSDSLYNDLPIIPAVKQKKTKEELTK